VGPVLFTIRRSLGLWLLHFVETAVNDFVDTFMVRKQVGVGRPSVVSQHPEFLQCLEATIEEMSGIVADARVNRGVSYKAYGSNGGARHYGEHLRSKYNIFLAPSTVLTYLRPRNIASLAARRHSVLALPIRPVYDAKVTAKLHVNAHYCCAAVKAMLLLAQLPTLRSETFCFSIDAKAHVKTGNNVRATVRPVKAWMPMDKAQLYAVADHDFLALKKYCLILNGFLAITPFGEHNPGDVKRHGDVSYVIRPWEFRPDSAVQQLDDFLLMLVETAGDPIRLENFLQTRKLLKLIEVSDGGPATKPSNSLVRLTAAFVFHLFSLDLLVRRTNSPETSKLNPVERCHSMVSTALGGTIPHGVGDEKGMCDAAQTVCEKIQNPGLTYAGTPVTATAWKKGADSLVPNILREYALARASEKQALLMELVVIPDVLLNLVSKLGRPAPRPGCTISNLLLLLSDGRHGSANSVSSTISRCNSENCAVCGGLWQGKPWVLCGDGSLPMPLPSETPGHYMPLTDLVLSTVSNDKQASWRPSDLIAEAIHGLAFCLGLQNLSLDSPAFVEVISLFVSFKICFDASSQSLQPTRVLRVLREPIFCWQNFVECSECTCVSAG
jgi:hypothetical protein